MKNTPNYYSVIPATVRYCKKLSPQEKLLYSEITALMNHKGYCWAHNSYFADLYCLTKETISRQITKLSACGFIRVEMIYVKDTKQVKERRIYLSTPDSDVADDTTTPIDENVNTPIDENINTPIDENINTPIDENRKENIINIINNTSMNKSSQSQSQSEIEEKTDMTPTNDMTISNQEIIPGNKEASAVTLISPYQQAEAKKHNQDDCSTYTEIIQENIEYESLTYQSRDKELVDNLIQIMLDVILTESPATVKIGKELKSRNIVKSNYLKLTGEHIQHVVNQYKAQHHKIKHSTAYLRTMLYTVYQEMELHITNQVRADGLVW